MFWNNRSHVSKHCRYPIPVFWAMWDVSNNQSHVSIWTVSGVYRKVYKEKRKKIKCAENRFSLSYWTMQLASRPLRPSATAVSAVKSPIENDDSVALRITRKRLEAHLYHNGAKHPFILRPHFLKFLEIWYKKSGSRNLVQEIWFDKSGWPETKVVL